MSEGVHDKAQDDGRNVDLYVFEDAFIPSRSEPSDVQQKKEAQLGIKSIDIEEEASHD